jgi:predicted alpha/beta superfamily hydrolase
MKKILFILIFLSFILQSVKAQVESFVSNNTHLGLQSSQLATDVTSQIVWSNWVNDNFKIFISLPEDYDPSREPKYPVVYFLDGGGGSFHTIMAELMQAQLIPDVITIGIGYPSTSQRDRDYTYGFMNFYQFMKQELIPQMDEEFNIDPMNRTLFGHSYGGICALFTMFQYNDYNDILFHNIIAASPSIWWPDDQLAYTRESSLYTQTSVLPVNLYMTVGSFEGFMVTDMERMQQVLESRNYEYFNASYHVNQGKDHTTNKEQTFRDGIPWVLRQDIQLPTNSKVLAQSIMETSIYPNPATDQITIVIPPALGAQTVTCSILDGLGKRIKTVTQQTVGQNNLHIPIDDLSKGMYIVHLTSGKIQQNLKFIKGSEL